mmetsp:Transcript_13499/g.19459  ORF Transcript_13499/g.19459 Transcript_13499/m.19459 type:complete len:352 (-) Transcript_13499:70-1125(-)
MTNTYTGIFDVTTTSSIKSSTSTRKRAQVGDIVTLELKLVPENGYVPIPLFDLEGDEIRLVLGQFPWGNYLPGLHSLVEGMRVGDAIENRSLDAGWGEWSEKRVVTVSKSKLKSLKNPDQILVHDKLHLQGDVEVLVTAVTPTTITVDANPPLAGASYVCSLKVKDIEELPEDRMVFLERPQQESASKYQVASFALGCFWGGQLEFQRLDGVVATRVGYTQGHKVNPSYTEICQGTTRHRETIMVVYDQTEISYQALMDIAMERLRMSEQPATVRLFQEEEESHQYAHGFYYHTTQQHEEAEAFLEHRSGWGVEVRPAQQFYNAEEYHQHYLLKGGQSARKNAKEEIRCFG